MDNNIQDTPCQQPTSTFAFPVNHEDSAGETALPRLDLGKRIEITFFSMGYRNLREVRCQHKDGKIILTGSTKTFYLKQVAQVIAAKVAGRVAIENLIVVDS